MALDHRYGRPSFLRNFGLVVLALVILVAILLTYAQTRHAFRHLLIPLVVHATGAKLDVRDGHLSLGGALEAEGLRYEDMAAGVSIDAEQLALNLAPWSFVKEGVVQIDNLELKQANLRVVSRAALAGASVHEPEPEPSSVTLLPVAVLRARFEDVAFTIEGEASRVTGRTVVNIDQLVPGHTGTVTLRTNFKLSRAGETEDIFGANELVVSIAADFLGRPTTWNGTNEVLLRSGKEGVLSDADPRVMIFHQTLDGEWAQAQQKGRLSSTIAASRQGNALGSVNVMATMDGTVEPAVTNLALTVKDVKADAVNLLLGIPVAHMHDGQFNAGVEGHIEGTHVSVRATVTGSQVQLRMGDRQVSPTVDVSLQHASAFDWTTRKASIDTLTVTLGDHARPMLSGSLDHPFSFQLDPPEGRTPRAGSVAVPATWSLRLIPTSVQVWRPWLALLDTDALNEVTSGWLAGTLLVTVQDEGALVEMAGRIEAGDVTLRNVHKDGPTPSAQLGIITDWTARITDLRTLRLDPLAATVNLKGKRVAALRVTGTGLVTGESALTGLDGTVTLERFPGEVLNPLLAIWSPSRISRSRFDGRAEFAVDERLAVWHMDLRGQGIELRLPNAHDAPAFNLLTQSNGKFDRTSRQLHVDRLNVQAADRRHPLVMLTLDQPLILNLAPAGENASVDAGREPIALGLRVDDLGVHQLRLWMALAGSQMPASVRGGALDADMTVTLRGVHHIAVAGRLDLKQLAFDGASTPITIGTNVTASVIDRSRIVVDVWEARALDGTRLLAQAHLAGSTGSSGATELRLNLIADEPTELITRFGLLTNRQAMVASGGRLTGELQMATAGSSKPLTITADLRSTNLKLHLDKRRSLTQTISLRADVEVDAAHTVIDIRRMELMGESAGIRTGTMTADGRWPMTAPQGEMMLKIKEWDCGPFMESFGFLPGRVPGSLPVTAEMMVTWEAEAKTLTVRGKESIGPMRVAMTDEPATLHLQHTVVRHDEEIRLDSMTLTADRVTKRADRVSLRGNVGIGSKPHVQVRGAVEELDAAWYLALAMPASTPTSQDHEQTAYAAGTPVLPYLDLDLGIGTVIYRTLEIGAGRLVIKGNGHRMQATLEPTGLADGRVEGTITLALKNEQPEFAWDFQGSMLNLGTLTKAWFTESDRPLTGRGQFTTAGTGRGRDERWRQSLKGMVTFDVADGQFIKVPVLEFLADQTRVDEFRHLVFKTLHGALEVKDGWINLQEARANGPIAGIEAEGKLALDGPLDIRVKPKIGPTLSQHVRIPCLDQLAKTVEGFTVLPLAVTIKGTVQTPSYGVDVTPGSMVERQAGALVGTIVDFLTVCRGGSAAKKMTEEAVGAVKDTVKDLIDDLFDSKQKR